ncbi:MAG: glycoside hydrolase family 2 protein [Planctomycetota bacterium]
MRRWQIQSADQVSVDGSQISVCGFGAEGWYETRVPSTVLAALVEVGQYVDPYFGTNLDDIPKERFEQCWWYRSEFDLSDANSCETSLLEFDGINYAANIWLNGRLIGDAGEVRGAFRRFSFDVSNSVKKGRNALALEVTPPKPGDFSTGFVDWNPPAPDRNMGIFRPVTLRCCGSVSIENPFVQADLDTETLDRANLTVTAELHNRSDQPVSGILAGRIDSISFEKSITLAPMERKIVEFTAEQHEDLLVRGPRLWWPHDLGEPNLYELHLEFSIDKAVSDARQTNFGIRSVEDYFNDSGHRGFRINGKQVLIKAGGWTDDMLLADTPEKLEAQIQYVKHMNLNCIRLEGIWGKDHTLYDLCDACGILMMVGWSCHWEHEQWLGRPVDERFGGITSPQDIDLMARSWTDQVLWLRNHPSIFVWTLGSDKVPHPDLERRYSDTLNNCDPTRPYLASTGGVGSEQAIIGSAAIVSDISGPTGVKMLGPYAYTPPVYWYEDRKRGGAYGFNTETGPGAQVPVLETLKKMIPPDLLWPINDCWDFHCGLNEFGTLNRFSQALESRFGPVDNVEQFAYRAQILDYELIRPMFEAFRINRPQATGVVQWMLNAAWPKLYWQLYDWYLMPTGAFYGTKKACEPCQLMYDYSRRSVYLVNDAHQLHDSLVAEIRVLDLSANEVLRHKLDVCGKIESVQELLMLPDLRDISATYFLDLRLFGPDGALAASNFYWLSTQSDILDYEAKVDPWEYYTPSKQYADFTLLNSLASTTVEVQHELETNNDNKIMSVELRNKGADVAFGIELRLADVNTGAAVVPIFWQDNYIALLPGESRTIQGAYSKPASDVSLDIHGWNIKKV